MIDSALRIHDLQGCDERARIFGSSPSDEIDDIADDIAEPNIFGGDPSASQ